LSLPARAALRHSAVYAGSACRNTLLIFLVAASFSVFLHTAVEEHWREACLAVVPPSKCAIPQHRVGSCSYCAFVIRVRSASVVQINNAHLIHDHSSGRSSTRLHAPPGGNNSMGTSFGWGDAAPVSFLR